MCLKLANGGLLFKENQKTLTQQHPETQLIIILFKIQHQEKGS